MIKKFKLFEYISHYLSVSKYDNFQLSVLLNISETESDEIYQQVANFYRKNPKLSYLGSGSYGSAFSMEEKVLKISTDKNEANNIEYLRKKNFKGIVTYYDLRKINLYLNGELYQDRKLYSIIMDRVYPLSDIELECYRILYSVGYVNSNDNLTFEYTLDYNYIDETSALNFKKLNNKSRAKKIIEIIQNSNYHDFRENCRRELGRSINFEFLELEDLQKSPKFEEIFLKFYDDILNLLCDVIRYKLVLYDSHEKNVGKDEDGHFKMIDLGFRTNHSDRKLKLKPIEIHVDTHNYDEEVRIFKSEDGEKYEYYNDVYSHDEAVDEINNELQKKNQRNIKIGDYNFVDYYDEDKHFIILSNIEHPEIFNRNVLINKDPDQLSLKF